MAEKKKNGKDSNVPEYKKGFPLTGNKPPAYSFDIYDKAVQRDSTQLHSNWGWFTSRPGIENVLQINREYREKAAQQNQQFQEGGEYEGQTLPEGDTVPAGFYDHDYSSDVEYRRPHMQMLYETGYKGGNKPLPYHKSGKYTPIRMKFLNEDYAHVNAARSKEDYDFRMGQFDKKYKNIYLPHGNQPSLEELKTRMDSVNINPAKLQYGPLLGKKPKVELYEKQQKKTYPGQSTHARKFRNGGSIQSLENGGVIQHD